MSELPKFLYVSGNKLLLAGFNGEYEFCGDKNNPKWKRDWHYLFFLLIRPTIIEKKKNEWILRTNDDFPSIVDRFLTVTSPPCGRWFNGIVVEQEYRPFRQFYHSYGKTAIATCILTAGAYYWWQNSLGLLGLATIAVGSLIFSMQ